MKEKGREISVLIGLPEVASASADVSKVLRAVMVGENTNSTMASAQARWKNIREGKPPANLTRDEFQELQGRLLLPCVRREKRYPESVSKELLAIVANNAGFMWAVIRDYHKALIAVPSWEIKSVIWWQARGLVQKYDEVMGNVPVTESSDELDLLADANAAATAASGERLQAMRRFAGLVKRTTAKDDGGEELDPTFAHLTELREQLAKMDGELAELIKAGAKMDVVKFGAAQAKRGELEAEITKLEAEEAKGGEGASVPVTDEARQALNELNAGRVDAELEVFLAKVGASVLTKEKKAELELAAIVDLDTACAEFTAAIVEFTKPAPEPPTPLEVFRARVEGSQFGPAVKGVLLKLAESDLAKAMEAFAKRAAKK